ncbi:MULTISPECIES: rubrerythrin family protein [unclassified Haladaptatus]|uniref:rubrerythrin family protein n=1 Tax=unclassified Haladaptatus TaxID=2622732 RepID=UPI0023E809E5|nr:MULTISPECIES: rubrerythrin family protein [unclassified Haladaptatus]
MTPEDFLDTVREENKTPLSRLGSSKALYADTHGDLDKKPVLKAAATAEHTAAETFEAWAESEENDTARAVFEAAAEDEYDHYEQVAAKLDDDDLGDRVPAIQTYLRDLEDPIARLGGFCGRVLVARASKKQLVGFFVGKADPKTSQLFRDLSSDLDEQEEQAVAALAELCDAEEDWATALDAASEALQAAYREYTETLEGMGVNPKPVC